MSRSPRPWLLASTLLVAGSAFALASLDARSAGWEPLVTLWGAGDPAAAVRTLRSLTAAYGVSLHHTELDPATRKFVDGVLEDLEDFDLASFHALLPEVRDGGRELWVRGDLHAGRYVVRRASSREDSEVRLGGPRGELAAMSLTLRSQEARTEQDKKAFDLGARLGLGIGPFRWERAVSALASLVRLASTGDPTPGAQQALPAPETARSALARLHPRLAPEDRAVVGPLFASFPALLEVASRLGTLDDVRTVESARGFRQLQVSLRGAPDRLREHHPALARYLDRLDQLARLRARWVDAQGRTLAELSLDSDTLTARLGCYVRDGRLLPFRGVQVFADEPVDLLGPELRDTQIVSDARLKMLGVVIKLAGLRLSVRYEPTPSHARIAARFTQVPSIHVEGAALGFVPTGLVDVFIPGNIESITRDFLRVAARGRGGRGVLAEARVGVAEEASQAGVLEAGVELEALDNFLVKLGVGMVNERMIPSERAMDDAKRFAADLHDAFVRDLGSYERRFGGAAL